MLYFHEKEQRIKAASLAALAALLKQGKVVVLPTDTLYGLSGLASKPATLKRINRLKRRTASQPGILLMANLAMLKKYAFVSRTQVSLLKKISATSSRPITFILRGRGLLPPPLERHSRGLACRLPKKEFLIKILKKVKQPLISTSVNLSGQPPLLDVSRLETVFPKKAKQPAAVLDIGPSRRSQPSRLLDIRNPQNIIILRN